MADFVMKWRGSQCESAVIGEVDGRLLACAELVADRMQQNVSSPGPEPSAPGEFPHKQSSGLHDSIRAVRNKQGEAMVLASATHAPYVEASRPFFRRTHTQMRSAMRAIMLGGSSCGGSGRFRFGTE